MLDCQDFCTQVLAFNRPWASNSSSCMGCPYLGPERSSVSNPCKVCVWSGNLSEWVYRSNCRGFNWSRRSPLPAICPWGGPATAAFCFGDDFCAIFRGRCPLTLGVIFWYKDQCVIICWSNKTICRHYYLLSPISVNVLKPNFPVSKHHCYKRNDLLHYGNLVVEPLSHGAQRD